MYKKIIILILLVLISVYSTGCDLIAHKEKYEKEKDEIEYYFNDPTLFRTEYFVCIEYKGIIAICDTTKKGDEVKELIIPEKINGKNVGYLGDPYGNPQHGPLSFGKELQKLFISKRIGNSSLSFKSPEVKVILAYDTLDPKEREYYKKRIVGYQTGIEILTKSIANIAYYIDTYDFLLYFKDYGIELFTFPLEPFIFAGFSYWSDDIEIGEKINTIPPVPEREGYTFEGWYTDLEFTNKWDFENGIPFPVQDSDDDQENQNELKLNIYGKWEEGEN